MDSKTKADLQPVRGTHDLLPEAFALHRHVESVAITVTGRYGYRPMAVPVMEFTGVFTRPLGETSDVVTKEMYSFQDRGGNNITLRPEATAGIARAFVSGKLQQALPLRFFTSGPMFRYERPQKGRQRQFHQVDAECLGPAAAWADVESIAMGHDFLVALGIGDTTLHLNTLGDTESRRAHEAALVDYFSRYRGDLSADSQHRLDRNPLRILDSKAAGDRALIASAPVFSDCLTAAAAARFDAVCTGLADLGIAFHHNPRLVRGLDYYCHTAFEFVTDRLGSQGTVLAGGRYDGLVGLLGGAPTPGVGWAAGIERLALLCAAPPAGPRPVAIVPLGAMAERRAAIIARDLRQAGLCVDLTPGSGTLSRHMRRAARIGASHCVIIGETELARNTVTLRDMDRHTQDETEPGALRERLVAATGHHAPDRP